MSLWLIPAGITKEYSDTFIHTGWNIRNEHTIPTYCMACNATLYRVSRVKFIITDIQIKDILIPRSWSPAKNIRNCLICAQRDENWNHNWFWTTVGGFDYTGSFEQSPYKNSRGSSIQLIRNAVVHLVLVSLVGDLFTEAILRALDRTYKKTQQTSVHRSKFCWCSEWNEFIKCNSPKT